MRLLVLFTLIGLLLGLQRPPSQKLYRLPFQKKKIQLEAPTSYAKRYKGIDPKSGQEIYYDPKPRVDLLESKSGKYSLKWIGYNGGELTVVYQRPDVIDAVVSASVSTPAPNQHLYLYWIENRASSGQDLGSFALQHYAADVKTFKTNHIYIGPMSNNKVMRDGTWIGFGILPMFKPQVAPGQGIEFRLQSSAPPGLVECRIRGQQLVMIGMGEDMPQELENILPGYEAWPSSYTIGPVDKLKGISRQEQISYLLKVLPQCKQQGWMTVQILRAYEQLLKQKNLQGIFTRIANDLKTNSITTEVFGMIEGMKI
ncbi:MAG: hypothetical protein L0226_13225 [Acidobacteria bacterium]|nr:hypothetical protein [Acidobacteriota bacterium]